MIAPEVARGCPRLPETNNRRCLLPTISLFKPYVSDSIAINDRALCCSVAPTVIARKHPCFGATAAVVVIQGAGVFVTTGQVAVHTAGPAVVVSYLVAGVSALLSSLCYAEFR